MTGAQTVYSVGYLAWRIDDLIARVEQLGAVLVDTRHVPYSRMRQWSKDNLARRLGARYRHVKGFGNLRWKETSADAIALADVDDGLRQVAPLLVKGPIMLLCACKLHETCHRREVARLVVERYGGSIVLVEPLTEERAAEEPAQFRLL